MYSHTVEHYSAIKRNEVHATICKYLEHIMLTERSQSQKTTYDSIYLKCLGKSIKTESRLNVA